MWVTKQLMAHIDKNKKKWLINCLVTDILQNIILCSAEEEKITQVWNSLRLSKFRFFFFGVNYPFK